jgi:hypothetical protein
MNKKYMCVDIANDSLSEPFPDPFLNIANHFLNAAFVSSVDIFRISLILTKQIVI